MATLKVAIPAFTINGSWQCVSKPKPKHGPVYVYAYDDSDVYVFKTGTPTYRTTVKKVSYKIPSGATVKKAQVIANISGLNTGASVLSANGNRLKSSKGVYSANITLKKSASSISIKFAYKPNGNKNDTAVHNTSARFSNVYLQIEYAGGKADQPKKPAGKKKTGVLTVPPQSCCIYDSSTGKTYLFDGVIKIQHQFSMKIEEEISKDKEKYVNNAKNEPDKLTLDVAMSDVYTGTSEMDSAASYSGSMANALKAVKNKLSIDGTRSADALRTLVLLKESRKKIAVITPQYVHVDMIISSVIVNQDESCPYGWSGQIIFQHAYAPKEKKKQQKAKDGGELKSTPSIFRALFGEG